MAPTILLGPPELRHQTPTKQETQSPVDIADPQQEFEIPIEIDEESFMSLLVDGFYKADISPLVPPVPVWFPENADINPTVLMGFTENGSATYVSAGNPCVDLFFHVVPNTSARNVTKRLKAAWDHDPLTTLKLICNLRGVRGTGKSNKEGFYTAAFWLYSHHPKTLACNVASFAEFGYVKDLLEIIYRILEGPEVKKNQKAEWELRKRGTRSRRRTGTGFNRQRQIKAKDRRSRSNSATREQRISDNIETNKIEKEKASQLRKEKKVAIAKKVIDTYNQNQEFQFLYECVSDYLAECLKDDIKAYNAGQFKKVSLAAKWCPSIDSSYDTATLICESIARKVFPKESYSEYKGVEDAHYAYRVRDRLRKQVLVPLRKCLELPEVFIGANRWDLIPYRRVASVAMKFYKEKFWKHDKERFDEYLADVRTGKAKIAAGALLPHEIIKSLNDNDGGQVAELQWKRVVDDLLKKGKLNNCLAISDVSGSMEGTPMEVAIALGVLVSELSEEPWKGKLITFSENPELQMVNGDDLMSKIRFVEDMEWDMNTDFQKVFDLILQVAVEGKLKPEQMIKRLFVFSDMEFDEASLNPWETDYQVIVRKYTEKGYGSVVPQIVFWNLRDSRATPVPSTQNGVALVSGFSKNLLKLFLDNDGEISPETFIEAAIAGEEYRKLVVMD